MASTSVHRMPFYQGEMSDGEEELLCPICSELYDDDVHVPLMLPRCGHNFCKLCLTGCGKKGHFPCPTCRKRHLKPPVTQLPPNVDLLTKAELLKESTLGRCPSHGNLQEFWCRQCSESLCGACNVSEGHDVLRTKLFLSEKKREVREQGSAILQNVVEEKEKIINKVKNCSLQLLKTCQLSTVTTSSGEDVKAVMNETKKTADIRSAMGSLKKMKSILDNLRSAAAEDSDWEPEEKQQNRKERNPLKALRDECHPNKHKRSRSKESLRQRDKVEKENALNNVKDTDSQRKRAVSNPPPAEGNKENNMDGSPLLGLLDSNLWPLKCCIYSEDGRRAALKWESGRLHLYALSKDSNDAHFMIKMSVLQTLIPQDNPEVFIDATAGEKYLGRIYIRLWGHLRRAHNFLAMCLGTHGVSYRGARFREVFARGIPGECLHAGEYPINRRGGESAAGVLKDLEWEGKYRKPMTKGLVVGAGSGRPDRDACFDICTKSNSARLFACPFGEVVGGWDVVMAVVGNKPVRQVFMTNVGVVIPDQSKNSN